MEDLIFKEELEVLDQRVFEFSIELLRWCSLGQIMKDTMCDAIRDQALELVAVLDERIEIIEEKELM